MRIKLNSYQHESSSHNINSKNISKENIHSINLHIQSIIQARGVFNAAENRFTIYRQPFTTGTDIPQANDAEGIVTIRRNILIRDLAQTVWRLRNIEGSQTVHFALSKDVAAIIRATLHLSANRKISDRDIIRFALINQVTVLEADNKASLGQKMLEVIQTAIMNILLDPGVTPLQMLELMNEEVVGIYTQTTPEQTFDLYGHLEEEVPIQQVVNALTKRMNITLKRVVESHPLIAARVDCNALQQRSAACSGVPTLPKMGLIGAESTLGQLVENEIIKDIRKEMLKETLSEPKNETFKNLFWSYDELPANSLNNPLAMINRTASTLSSFTFLPNIVNTAMHWLSSPCALPYSDYLSKHAAAKPFLEKLFPRIFVSTNWAPPIAYRIGRHVAEPFGPNEKPCDHVILVVEPFTQASHIIIGDNGDCAAFYRVFERQRESGSADPNGRILVVYNLQIGVVQMASSSYSEYAVDRIIEEDLDLQKGIAQIKLLNSYSKFTEMQKQLLKSWIQDIGKEKARQAYFKTVLSHHPKPAKLWVLVEKLFE